MVAHDPFHPSSGAKPPQDDAPASAVQAGAETQGTKPADNPPAQGNATGPAPETAAGEAVPAGTSKEVLAWVGSDKDRARAALTVEQESDEPRKGLTRELEELLSDGTDSGS